MSVEPAEEDAEDEDEDEEEEADRDGDEAGADRDAEGEDQVRRRYTPGRWPVERSRWTLCSVVGIAQTSRACRQQGWVRCMRRCEVVNKELRSTEEKKYLGEHRGRLVTLLVDAW